VDAEYGIDKTVKGALNRNYKITVIQDAIGSSTIEKLDNKILEFTKLGLEIISTEQVLK
jgi:nicotinamidase-related amidase